ncbi:hypothetical protein GPECTOR_2g1541 [Gonium pectorale]|uniref:USP domain-containing protein n=1 Tax=Gonium pectorale TaxID=33097 RepID=A0A150H1J3_GONPE|nr:hypothetical protein GPECTOR_2g1541 [Gonium pectorale]|eukprot:KXZ55989.1 hypothetical protein GPECTOR_2g1541 [Gonium pectorale]
MLALQGMALLMRRRGVLPLAPPARRPPPSANLDAAGTRLARLCDYVLTMGDGASVEGILMAVCLHQMTKPEHVDVVERLYGEIPVVLANVLDRQKANANGDAGSGPEPESEGFGPFFEFRIKERPAAERQKLEAQWRRDVADSIALMQDGNCQLGKRFAATVAAFISNNTPGGGARPQDMSFSGSGLERHLAALPTPALLQLRLFVVTQLGLRLQGTLLAMQVHVEYFERLSTALMWGLEMVKDGKEGEKVRMSEACYDTLRNESWTSRHHELRRLRIAHAMRRELEASLGPAKFDPANVAAALKADGATVSVGGAAAAAGTASGGGSKKKGKGGGGGSSSGTATAAASAAGDDAMLKKMAEMLELPKLPEGSSLPAYDSDALLDYSRDKLHELDALWLRRQALLGSMLCPAEVMEQLAFITDPPEDAPEPGTAEANKMVLWEVLNCTPVPNGPDPSPVFGIRECWTELLTSSELQPGDKDEILGALKPELPDWAYQALEKAAHGAARSRVAGGADPLETLRALRAVTAALNSDAFLLLADMAAVGALAFISHIPDMDKAVEDCDAYIKKAMPPKDAEAEGGKAGSAGAKGSGKGAARPTKSAEQGQAKLNEVNSTKQFLENERNYVHSVREFVARHVRELHACSEKAKSSMYGSLVRPAAREPRDCSPDTIVRTMRKALSAVQVFCLTLSQAEMTAELVAVQARVDLKSAIMNDPLLEPGLVGLNAPRIWLKAKLQQVDKELSMNFLLEEELKEKEMKEKEAKEREKKLLEQRRKDQQRREEEDRKRREEEERRQQEEEAEAAKERERQRLEEEENKKKREVKYYETDDDEEEEEAVSPAKAPVPAARAPPSGKGGKEGPAAPAAGGPKPGSAMLGRLEAMEKEKVRDIKAPPPAPQQAAATSGGRRDAGPAAGGPPAPAPPAPTPAAGPHAGKNGPQAHAAAPAGPGGKPAAPVPAPAGPDVQGRKVSGPAPAQQQRQPHGRDAGAAAGPSGREPEKGGRGHPPAAAAAAQAGSGKAVSAGGAQPQQQPGPKGAAGGRHASAPASSAAAASSKSAPSATKPSGPKIVPGFDPESHAQDNKGKPRKRRGGVGGGGGAPGGEAAAAANGGASTWGDDTAGEIEDLTAEPAEPAGPADRTVTICPTEEVLADYPFVFPYPGDPPPGFLVYEGLLYSIANVHPKQLLEDALRDYPGQDVAEFTRNFLVFVATRWFRENGFPDVVPPEARKRDGPAPDDGYQRPYAVPAEVPQPEHLERPADRDAPPPHAAAAAGSPAAGYPPAAPALGMPPMPLFPPGAAPPPHMALGGRPPMPFPNMGLGFPPLSGMVPGFQPQMPFGMPPRPMGPPGIPVGHPVPPVSPSPGDDGEDETNDLLGLLGVGPVSEPVRPAAHVAAPTPPPYAASPVPPFGAVGMPPPGMPYGAPRHPPPAYGVPGVPYEPMPAPPPAAPAAPAQDEMEVEDRHILPPPPAAEPHSAPAVPQRQQQPAGSWAAAAAAAPAAASWAQLAAGKAALTAVGRIRGTAGQPATRPRAPAGEEALDSEESQYNAAIRQSWQSNPHAAFPPLAGSAAAAPPAAADEDEDLMSLLALQQGTGLVNRVGEYNCFLNVIIQCLWHCTAFRAQLAAHAPDAFTATGHRVVAALLRLFRALDAADAARQNQQAALARRGGSEAAAERHVVDPSELREALDELGVRAGEMNDASEVLGEIFACLNRAPGLSGASPPAPGPLSVVDRVFGMVLSEEVRCREQHCRKITHVVSQHVEYFVIVTATGLREMPAVMDGGRPSTGRIIREIEMQHVKRCDRDPPHGGCNTPTPVTRTLHNVPAVFSVQLAWEPDVPADAIAGTMSYVDTILNPTEIFPNGNCPPELTAYALHGMFCYYGQHYFAFINRGPVEPDSAQEWVMFDDATVSAVGGWAEVVAKCRAGRIQPSVLFYQQINRR